MSEVVVRAYEARDRSAIRALCFETGDKGSSARTFFADSELFSDLWTLYYTDIEPESTWVAEVDGEFAGYLSCSFHESKSTLLTLLYVLPIALFKALLRGTLFRPYIWNIVFGTIICWIRTPIIRVTSKNKFDSHLHINLNKNFRGRKIGESLLLKLFDKSKSLGTYGVMAGVRADNGSGLQFFQRQGFIKLEEQPGFHILGIQVKAVLLGKIFK